MTQGRSPRIRAAGRWLRAGPLIAIGLLLVANVGAGCGGSDEPSPVEPGAETSVTPESGTPESSTPEASGETPTPADGDTSVTDGGGGNGTIGTLVAAAKDPSALSPFDATPDLDGKTIYFTAMGAKGAGVFKVAASGGAVTELYAGPPFVTPMGIAISTDGKQLFIADIAAETTADQGAIFVLPIAGGTPVALSGTDGAVPRGLEIAGDKIYFTGNDATGARGVFSVGISGGALTTIAAGAPFEDPSGIAVTKSGTDIYVVDSIGAPSGRARLIKITGGVASTIIDELVVGSPAGIAISHDETALLISALDPVTNTDKVHHVTLATKSIDSSFTMGIDKFNEPAGLHRAKNADVYAWADSLANDTGTVFVLSK